MEDLERADRVRGWLAEGETESRFLVQGRHAVAAALESEFEVDAVVTMGDAPAALTERGVPVLSIGKAEAERLLGFAFHRGMLAIARKPTRDLAAWWGENQPTRVVVLENLADPGNVGTVIRNAAAFGFDAVICSQRGASPYNAKAVRASATGIFRMPVFVEGDWLQRLGKIAPAMDLVATDLSPDAISLEKFARTVESTELAVVFGSEANGLSPETLAACRYRIRIPLSDRVESLNVASASAILLHAIGASEAGRPGNLPVSL